MRKQRPVIRVQMKPVSPLLCELQGKRINLPWYETERNRSHKHRNQALYIAASLRKRAWARICHLFAALSAAFGTIWMKIRSSSNQHIHSYECKHTCEVEWSASAIWRDFLANYLLLTFEPNSSPSRRNNIPIPHGIFSPSSSLFIFVSKIMFYRQLK